MINIVKCTIYRVNLTTRPELYFRPYFRRTDWYKALLRDEADDVGVVVVQDDMARIHDELDEVVEVFATRKGVEDMGPKEGKANNQHERLLGVEVGEGGDRDLLHRGSDRGTESRLLPGGRIVNVGVPVMVPLLAVLPDTEDVPPSNSVTFLDRGIPNNDERKGLVGRVHSDHLHHVLDLNHPFAFPSFLYCCVPFYSFVVPCGLLPCSLLLNSIMRRVGVSAWH